MGTETVPRSAKIVQKLEKKQTHVTMCQKKSQVLRCHGKDDPQRCSLPGGLQEVGGGGGDHLRQGCGLGSPDMPFKSIYISVIKYIPKVPETQNNRVYRYLCHSDILMRSSI